MNKTILFGKEAREKVKKGANIMADVVSVTLGANGRNVLLSENVVVDYGTRALPVKVTKDGISAARSVHITDPVENIGAMLLREASDKTMLMCGDGTTTTIVLARAIVNAGLEMIDAGGNPMDIKRQVDNCVEYIVSKIKDSALPVRGDVETIRKIATVSANNDASIGDLVTQAFEQIGEDGIIDIEESKSVNTEIKITEGFQVKSGYLSPFFITDKAKKVCELINPNILLFEKVINNMKEFMPALQASIETNMPLLIICEDADGEALSSVIMNTIHGKIPPVCIIKCPSFTENKLEIMEDIAACTGGTYLTDSKGIGLARTKKEHLGKAQKVIVTETTCTIIGGEKKQGIYEDLLNDLKMNLAQAKGEDEKVPIERRIARLKGGIAVIYVGGPTETEMKERVDRVDDAVRAAKSANEEGYVPGAGITFLKAIRGINSGFYNENKLGWDILYKAMEAPFRQICINAGLKYSELLPHVEDHDGTVGFNAKTGKIENLLEAGIIDPVKVLRCSLQNAASVAGMLLTSECLIVDTF